MTLFSSIAQVENDCNVKSTNGFMGNRIFFLARVKQSKAREKCNEIERKTIVDSTHFPATISTGCNFPLVFPRALSSNQQTQLCE